MILFLYPCGEKCALYLSFYKHFYRVFSLQISSYALCESWENPRAPTWCPSLFMLRLTLAATAIIQKR